IDASTCLFPEYTWFVKNASHSDRTNGEYDILYTVMRADRQLTVDDFGYTQFMVYDNETKTMMPMTEENCDTYNWTANSKEDNPQNKDEWVAALIASFVRWLGVLIKIIIKLLSTAQAAPV
ncbi:MAG: hypothetical protein ACI4RU_06080, partial [Acutalibacteraceae bacterium]